MIHQMSLIYKVRKSSLKQFKLAILFSLSGKDKETKDRMAFSIIVDKFETSTSRNKWNYLIKNLILLDR